jgi:hypothetical protein
MADPKTGLPQDPVPMLTATLQLDRAKSPSLLRVSVPKGIPADKLAKLNHEIVEKVIKVHTGCSCLSGTINVLLESNWEAPMQVHL